MASQKKYVEKEKWGGNEKVEWRNTRLYSSSATIRFSCCMPRILTLSRIFAGIWFTHKIFTLPKISLEFESSETRSRRQLLPLLLLLPPPLLPPRCCNANSRRKGPSKSNWRNESVHQDSRGWYGNEGKDHERERVTERKREVGEWLNNRKARWLLRRILCESLEVSTVENFSQAEKERKQRNRNEREAAEISWPPW